MNRSSRLRQLVRTAFGAALVGLLLTLVLPVGAANAAAYRYWGYFQYDGTTWQFATKGPDQTKPKDGAVEGWRFATATEDSTRTPRVEKVSFEDICAGTDAASGKKRVAVVIDYGRAADNEDGSTPPDPVGRCATVASNASGLEVLGAVADVRTEKSLVCGLDGYPASGCGGAVDKVSAAAKAPDSTVELKTEAGSTASAQPGDAADDSQGSDGVSVRTWIGITVAALAVLVVAGAAALRRRSV